MSTAVYCLIPMASFCVFGLLGIAASFFATKQQREHADLIND